MNVSDVAPLFGYTGAVMTLAKTILYMSQEYFCSGCSVGHNDLLVAFFFWIMPNLYAHVIIRFERGFKAKLLI
ncbi:hypothetical protein DXG01_004826 [Tephrocybe rancida]|nr:hypothetical protein DXG01_004826 [Tephrocybe rancida]